MNKKIIPLIFIHCLMGNFVLLAQPNDSNLESISIEQCYDWARENYPVVRQLDLIDKTTQYSLGNASNGNLPQIALNGQATLQSDVTGLPIDLPNLEIPTIAKDQYKIYGEVYQPITNFGKVNIQKNIIENGGETEKQKLETDLYQLKDRVNQLYFGTLLLGEKTEQFRLVLTDLDSALVRINAAIENGTATLTDRQLLQVERISIHQQINENVNNQQTFLEMLSTLTGKVITSETKLELPNHFNNSTTINRPELQLFALQNQAIDLQKKQISNNLLPNVGVFVQGGYGRPALNFLSNDFDFYYIGGVRFNWNLSSFYNFKNLNKTLDLSKEKIRLSQETFLLNTKLTQSQQSSETKKYADLIRADKEIIKIREEVLLTAKVQLDNGLITTIDYVKILNDANKAKQLLLLHETQLLLAQYNLKTTLGN